MIRPYLKLTFGFILVTLVSCMRDELEFAAFKPRIPSHFPPVEEPVGNEWSPERWQLGKALFFDTRLSADGKVSCASCHNPLLAFSDDQPLSLGFEGRLGRSNAPTLTNVAYHPLLTRAGGVPTLEQQVLVPIQEHDEFNSNILEVVDRLQGDREYQRLSQRGYGRDLDPFVLVRAISNFERTLISGRSRYDNFINGNSHALTAEEQKGMVLFFDDSIGCASCHSGFNFTSYAFENNGLKLDYGEIDRRRFTGLDSDEGKFKVPTLRNISVTGPYMHDGSLASLEEVIEHYNTGGVRHSNQSAKVRPLSLTNSQKAALLAFLESLLDAEFLYNLNFQQ